MKAKELRIGNWVLNEYRQEAMQVYPMMIQQISKIQKDGKTSGINPIPITEEWLERFGFIKEDGVYILGLFTIDLDDFSFTFNESNWMPIKIRYIHQLQNLYFALTGEELELK